MKLLLRWIWVGSALTYPLGVIAVWLMQALVGEAWWPTMIALYLPPIAFAVPLPFIVVGLLVWGPRRLLPLQVLVATIIAFPLMGLRLGIGRPAAATRAPTLRILSYNVGFGRYGGASELHLRLEEAASRADVVVLQATSKDMIGPLEKIFAGHLTRRAGEFFVASRYPIIDFMAPDPIDGDLNPAFVRVTLATPLGVLDVFETHPESPRHAFEAVREEGLRGLLQFSGAVEAALLRNSQLRERQVAAVAESARRSTRPVIIAGDTNLPELSPLFRRYFREYTDGFAEVGRGFGYTFPSHRWIPWMRLDRVLASSELRFLDFDVCSGLGSDHYCVVAELTRR